SSRIIATACGSTGDRPDPVRARPHGSPPAAAAPSPTAADRSHVRDQLLHPVVNAAERVLAEHRPLRLIVQLQVDPVDGVVAPLRLRLADEVAAELGTGRLRRLAHRGADVLLV